MADRLLLVEDEKNLGTTLSDQLKRKGFDVTWAQTVEDAVFAVSRIKFGAALVDIGLPDGSGYDVVKVLRNKNRNTAIIFLTAHGNPEDRIQGLELGAEDYIVKPFHLKELFLRLQNGLRRTKLSSQAETPQSFQVGKAMIHFDKFSAEIDGKTFSLSSKETAILRLLVERKGHVVSRDEMLEQFWTENELPTSRTIDNFMMRIRRLVEVDPEHPNVIRSVRGIGYVYE